VLEERDNSERSSGLTCNVPIQTRIMFVCNCLNLRNVSSNSAGHGPGMSASGYGTTRESNACGPEAMARLKESRGPLGIYRFSGDLGTG